MSEIKKRCFGKFELVTKFVEHDIELIANILCKMKFVPFRVEYNYTGNCFMYEGYSPLFREVEYASIIPMYRVVLTKQSAQDELNVSVEEIQ